MNFDDVIQPLLTREGGYVDHPYDQGGATNRGITQTVFTGWLAQQGKSWRSVQTLTEDEAARIYFAQYWVPAKCADLPPGIRNIHFDSAVNHGVGRAIRLLQEAAGVDPDGVIGPQTMAALATIAPELLKFRYVGMRYRFYGRIIARDRSQLAFITGWLRRMEDFVV
jgi:lysozyme family protein